MSNRELVIDLVNKLPENTPLEDIARKIEFVAGVKKALAEAERGECVSADETRQLIKIWASKSS
jgi:predicted transcriptional regulator